MEITEELKQKLQEARLHNIEDIQATDIPAGMSADDVVKMLFTQKPHLFAAEPPPKHCRDMTPEEYTRERQNLLGGTFRRSL